MLIDSKWNFVPPQAPLSLVAAAGVSVASTIIDLLGYGVGVAPSASIIGNATVFGADAGVGVIKPQVAIAIGTGLVTATSATLNVAFQGAEDTGSGGGYLPGAWQTFNETGALTAAQLTAGTIFGRFDFPPAFPANFNPRYLRLLFQIPSGTDFTAGTVAWAVVTMDRDDTANRFTPSNFKV